MPQKNTNFSLNNVGLCYYEQLNGKTVDITDEVPFDLPDTWAWCRLRSLGYIVGGGTPSTTNPSYWGGAIPWLSPADLTGYSQKYITHGKKNITELTAVRPPLWTLTSPSGTMFTRQ